MGKHDIESRKSVRDAQAKIRDVIDILRANESDEWARFLDQKIVEMRSWYDTKESFFQIGEVCHPKALGDLFVHGMDHLQWLDQIAELKGVCAQAFDELESEGPPTS